MLLVYSAGMLYGCAVWLEHTSLQARAPFAQETHKMLRASAFLLVAALLLLLLHFVVPALEDGAIAAYTATWVALQNATLVEPGRSPLNASAAVIV